MLKEGSLPHNPKVVYHVYLSTWWEVPSTKKMKNKYSIKYLSQT